MLEYRPAEGEDYVEHVTEDAVALRVAEREAGRLRYCHESDAWFVWDGVAWRRDRTGVAFQAVRDIARDVGLGPFGKPRAAPGSLRFMIGVERLARCDPALAVTATDWGADPYLLGTPGGTVRLRTGELAEADPKDGIDRTTALAPAAAADCPLWLHCLDEATHGNAALVRFLQQFFGAALSGAGGERDVLFAQDATGTGASALLATIAGILGDYARPVTLPTVAGAAAAGLRGIRLATVNETAAGRPWPEAAVRLFTEDDRTCADMPRPAARLFVVGTAPPILNHLDAAARRRICVVPFKRRADAPDSEPPLALEAERAGILRWMIEGCLDWQANGLVRPPCVIAATARAFAAHDVFGQFLEDKCLCGPSDPTKAAPAGALFAEWRDYAEAAGERPGSPRTFAEAMQRRGFVRDRLLSGRIFRGVSLRSAPADGARYALRCAIAERARMTA